MAIGMAAFAAGDIRRLFDQGTAAGLGDAQLLERFAAGGDGPAFAALVARHGPMVLGTCRGVLKDPHDSEDAFQAVFLVLAKKAGSLADVRSLGGWLYRVALRVALEANARSARRRRLEAQGVAVDAVEDRRRVADDEPGRVIHEELRRLPEKYRDPVVLCDLEGLTREQAAEQLRWPVGTVSGRLARARVLLRDRLTRRGITVAGALVGPALARRATASVPENWAEAATRAALAGAGAGVAPAASALARSVGRTMSLRRAAHVSAALVAVGATAGGLLAVVEDRRGGNPAPMAPAAVAEPAPREGRVAVRGRVVDPSGKAVAGARIYLGAPSPQEADPPPPELRARSAADGSFGFEAERGAFAKPRAVAALAEGFGPAWALVADVPPGDLVLKLAADDVPLTGRVLDLQGRGVPGVAVQVSNLIDPPGTDLVGWLRDAAGKTAGEFWTEAYRRALVLGEGGPLPAATTGADGRFRLRGLGRDRLALLTIAGEPVATDFAAAVTRSDAGGPPLSLPREPGVSDRLQGPDVTITAGPTRPIVGVVRDVDTNRPIAGVRLTAGSGVRATTDDRGRYRLSGLPKSAKFGGSIATETTDQPYPKTIREVKDAPGLGPTTLDIALKRGVWVKGRVTDAATGRPVAGATIEYFPRRDNPAVAGAADFTGLNNNVSDEETFTTDADGRYRAVALSGRGLLAVQAKGYRTASPLTPADAGTVLHAANFEYQMRSYQGLVPIDVPSGAASVLQGIALDPARAIRGTVVGPDGRPVAGAKVYGLEVSSFLTEPLPGSDFTFAHPNPGRAEGLVFLDERTGLGASVELKGDEPGPVRVALGPTGTVAGRLVDADGLPRPGVELGVMFLRKYRGDDVGGDHLVRRVTTDRDGRFRFGLLVPGVRYEVGVDATGNAPGYVDRTWWTIGPGQVIEWGDVREVKIGVQ